MTILIYIVVRIIISSISKLISYYIYYILFMFFWPTNIAFRCRTLQQPSFHGAESCAESCAFCVTGYAGTAAGYHQLCWIYGDFHKCGTPESSILDWGFPWNKPSSYWGTPICGNPHIRSVFLSIFPASGQANQKWGELWNYRELYWKIHQHMNTDTKAS